MRRDRAAVPGPSGRKSPHSSLAAGPPVRVRCRRRGQASQQGPSVSGLGPIQPQRMQWAGAAAGIPRRCWPDLPHGCVSMLGTRSRAEAAAQNGSEACGALHGCRGRLDPNRRRPGGRPQDALDGLGRRGLAAAGAGSGLSRKVL